MLNKNIIIFFHFIVCFMFCQKNIYAQYELNWLNASDKAILKKIDMFAGMKQNVTLKAVMINEENDKIIFDFARKDSDKYIFSYIYPRSIFDKKELVLTNNYWQYNPPNVISLGLTNMLVSKIEHINILLISFVRDYLLVNKKKQKNNIILLELIAKKSAITPYKKINVLVDESFKPVKMHFFDKTDLIKAVYLQYKSILDGVLVPNVLTIYDLINNNKKTIINLQNFNNKVIADYWFHHRMLPKFKVSH